MDRITRINNQALCSPETWTNAQWARKRFQLHRKKAEQYGARSTCRWSWPHYWVSSFFERLPTFLQWLRTGTGDDEERMWSLLLGSSLALLWTPKNQYHCPAGGLFEGVVLFLVPTNPTHMLTRHHPLFWFCIRPIALTTGPTYHHILPSTIHSMSYVKRKTTSLVSLQLQVDKGRFHCLIIQIMLPSSLSCRRTRNPWILIC